MSTQRFDQYALIVFWRWICFTLMDFLLYPYTLEPVKRLCLVEPLLISVNNVLLITCGTWRQPTTPHPKPRPLQNHVKFIVSGGNCMDSNIEPSTLNCIEIIIIFLRKVDLFELLTFTPQSDNGWWQRKRDIANCTKHQQRPSHDLRRIISERVSGNVEKTSSVELLNSCVHMMRPVLGSIHAIKKLGLRGGH